MKPKQHQELSPAPSLTQEPNTYQIATLAAAFIRPQDDMADSRSMKRVTSLAISLWNASEDAVHQWNESKERQSHIKDYQAKVPQVPEWRDIAKEKRKPISYERGLEVLFKSHGRGKRDSLMLDFLNYLASSEPKAGSIARDNWRRMKKGFQPGEFGSLAALLPQWLNVRRSLTNSVNAKQRKTSRKKPLEG